MRLALAAVGMLSASPLFAAAGPKFKAQEIDTGLKIGYAVVAVDIDGDKKPDLVVVDQHKVVWYRNPGKQGAEWPKFTILDGKTKPDNVCVAPIDIDGDGLPELAVGAAWKPFDTANPGQLVWLKRGADVSKEWSMHELPCDEPTVHRVRCIDIDGDGKDEIVYVPLMGRGASAKGNWTDGKPVRVIALKAPAKNPEKKESWKSFVLSEELNVCHNFDLMLTRGTGTHTPWMVAASYEGVHILEGPNQFPPTTVRGRRRRSGPGTKRTRGATAARARSRWASPLNAGVSSLPSSRGTGTK